ncbi:unnamed protein product, partial [Protopolystoma xenopodis]
MPSYKLRIYACITSLFIICITPFDLWESIFEFVDHKAASFNLANAVRSTTAFHLANIFFYSDKKSKGILLPTIQILDDDREAGLSDLRREAENSLKSAIGHRASGHISKALKLLEHAVRLDPNNADIYVELGQVLEEKWRYHIKLDDSSSTTELNSRNFATHPVSAVRTYSDFNPMLNKLISSADHMYGMALTLDPVNTRALINRRRTLPLIEKIDQHRFNLIDMKMAQFYKIPETNPGLRQAKLDHYFRHIYHSSAIEGNTLSLAQTRSLLETRLAVGGKSIIEQNEILGLDLALRFLNTTLLRGPSRPLGIGDILELHRRVLAYVDISEAGRFRHTQVCFAYYFKYLVAT